MVRRCLNPHACRSLYLSSSSLLTLTFFHLGKERVDDSFCGQQTISTGKSNWKSWNKHLSATKTLNITTYMPKSKLYRSLGVEGLGAGKQTISAVGEQLCCRGTIRLHFLLGSFILEQIFLQQYGYVNDIMHASWLVSVYEQMACSC